MVFLQGNREMEINGSHYASVIPVLYLIWERYYLRS